MSEQEQNDSLIGGRQRRSAASKNKSWAGLMSSASKREADDDDSNFVPRTTPRQRNKKSKVESKTPEPVKAPTSEKKSTPSSQEKKHTPISPQAPRLFPSVKLPQTVKMGDVSNGSKSLAAFGKEQVDTIEKEMLKTYMSNESEEFSDEDETLAGLLDDDDDEDFIAKPKRTYTKRITTTIRGGIRGRGNGRPILSNSRPTPYSSQPRIGSRPVPTLRYASSNASYAQYAENRPVKMVVLRQPNKPADGIGDNIRSSIAISSMSVASKEIEEINRKFGDRIVSGDSVRKFNDLIGILVSELKLMAEDRERMARNHEELTEQMNLSHSAALDIKDSRIRQLENYVKNLQGQIAQMTVKLQSAYSHHESQEKAQTNDEEHSEGGEESK